MPERAAIDNDFLNHLLEIKRHTDLTGLIKRFFKALNVSVFMHPLVYTNEAVIIPNTIRESLIQDHTITLLELPDIWKNQSGGKAYYEMMVRNIYKDFTGEEYPCDVFAQWVARQSLGEVHTVVACAFILCNCFLSDDRDAAKHLQQIVSNKLNHPIKVFNRKSSCDCLRELEVSRREGLTSKELKMISHPLEPF